MKLKLSDLWRWDGEIAPAPFLLWAAVLFAVKYNLDRLVLKLIFNHDWSLLSYFGRPMPWPDGLTPARNPAEFALLSSSTRTEDRAGTVAEDQTGITDTAPLETSLPPSPGTKPGDVVPVRLRSRVTEVGTLEVYCVARDGEKWKLEFDIRAKD